MQTQHHNSFRTQFPKAIDTVQLLIQAAHAAAQTGFGSPLSSGHDHLLAVSLTDNRSVRRLRRVLVCPWTKERRGVALRGTTYVRVGTNPTTVLVK